MHSRTSHHQPAGGRRRPAGDRLRRVEPAVWLLVITLLAVGSAGVAALGEGRDLARTAAESHELVEAYEEAERHVLSAELARARRAGPGMPRGEAWAGIDAAVRHLRILGSIAHAAEMKAVEADYRRYRALASGESSDGVAPAAQDLLEGLRAGASSHSREAGADTARLSQRLRLLQAGLMGLLALGAATGIAAGRTLLVRRRSLERHAEEKDHKSQHDELTGLPNRLRMTSLIAKASDRARSDGGRMAVLWLDLDGFKAVNDGLGHGAGDEVLKQMADALRDSLRAQDVLGRFGGDEFVVLCPDVPSSAAAIAVAQRLGEAARRPLRIGERDHMLSASIGVAHGPMESADAMLGAADAAMYQAKALGPAQYAVFDESMREAEFVRLQLTSELAAAADNGELRLHYQPLLDLATQEVIGAEALLRWQHPTRGLLYPAEFLPLAERTGHILRLGTWVIGEACRTLAGWERQRTGSIRPPRLSVNLAAAQLAQPDIVDMLRSALAEHGVDPERLGVEVTESAVMTDVDGAIAALEDLRRLGVHISIDDFGTGYSSLSYLKRFPAHELKLDRSFVSGIDRDPRDSSIVTAVVSLCHATGLSLVVEGVETENQRRLLHRLGCTTGQGFLWSPPLDQDELDRWLDSRGQLAVVSLPPPGQALVPLTSPRGGHGDGAGAAHPYAGGDRPE